MTPLGIAGRLTRRGRRRVPGPIAFATGAGAMWLATYLDTRRRHIARDRAKAAMRDVAETVDRKARYASGVAQGVGYRATVPIRRESREYDDVTLARKWNRTSSAPPMPRRTR